MVSKKSFTLLVDTGKIPIFTVFSIIFEQDCRKCYFPANFAVWPLIFCHDCRCIVYRYTVFRVILYVETRFAKSDMFLLLKKYNSHEGGFPRGESISCILIG